MSKLKYTVMMVNQTECRMHERSFTNKADATGYAAYLCDIGVGGQVSVVPYYEYELICMCRLGYSVEATANKLGLDESYVADYYSDLNRPKGFNEFYWSHH